MQMRKCGMSWLADIVELYKQRRVLSQGFSPGYDPYNSVDRKMIDLSDIHNPARFKTALRLREHSRDIELDEITASRRKFVIADLENSRD